MAPANKPLVVTPANRQGLFGDKLGKSEIGLKCCFTSCTRCGSKPEPAVVAAT